MQRKVIIGDEMGLGKTVEAIAVLAHLRAKGSHHFLVICPAAVVTNWVREVAVEVEASTPHRLHGPDRRLGRQELGYVSGGVAVTTFETLPWLIGAIVDPADAWLCRRRRSALHQEPRRAQDAARLPQLIDSCERAILLTGTPLENRLDEFRNLVGYLRPDLARGCRRVRAAEVSPPGRTGIPASQPGRRPDRASRTRRGRRVVPRCRVRMRLPTATLSRAGNFMAMRQAAMTHGIRSQKMQRLVEIVEEAEDNGRRVIVFSYFRDVLDRRGAAMPGHVSSAR